MDKSTDSGMVHKMKEFLISVIILIVLTLAILYTKPHTWFYHGMVCSGGIGGGCDTTTATGGLFEWMKK